MPITGATKLLALIGDPLTHAKTPTLANQLLESRQLLGKYILVPLHVGEMDLSMVVESLRHIQNFAGAVVTMPHKTAITPLLDHLSPEAETVGAVNVIRRDNSGNLVGTILDGEGFVGGLIQAGYSVQGACCLLQGAGGAASAIAFALAKHGCKQLIISNRSQAKAEALAACIQREFPQAIIYAAHREIEPGLHFNIAINATRLGMNPEDELPFNTNVIDQADLIAECVISVEETPLLQLAKSKGKKTHTGLPMLHAQLDMMLAFMMAE